MLRFTSVMAGTWIFPSGVAVAITNHLGLSSSIP